jgi:hypothetical protein
VATKSERKVSRFFNFNFFLNNNNLGKPHNVLTADMQARTTKLKKYPKLVTSWKKWPLWGGWCGGTTPYPKKILWTNHSPVINFARIPMKRQNV